MARAPTRKWLLSIGSWVVQLSRRRSMFAGVPCCEALFLGVDEAFFLLSSEWAPVWRQQIQSALRTHSHHQWKIWGGRWQVLESNRKHETRDHLHRGVPFRSTQFGMTSVTSSLVALWCTSYGDLCPPISEGVPYSRLIMRFVSFKIQARLIAFFWDPLEGNGAACQSKRIYLTSGPTSVAWMSLAPFLERS